MADRAVAAGADRRQMQRIGPHATGLLRHPRLKPADVGKEGPDMVQRAIERRVGRRIDGGGQRGQRGQGHG